MTNMSMMGCICVDRQIPKFEWIQYRWRNPKVFAVIQSLHESNEGQIQKYAGPVLPKNTEVEQLVRRLKTISKRPRHPL